jgi:hypothetical protein
MNELLQNLLYIVLTACVPIIVTSAINYLKAKRAEKLQKLDNDYIKDVILDTTDIILNAVDTVSQVYVDDLKKEGKFDDDKQKEALNKALTQAKMLINEEASELIVEQYNNLDVWIRSIIESYISSKKDKNVKKIV